MMDNSVARSWHDPTSEEVLLRLYRCLRHDQQADLLQLVMSTLNCAHGKSEATQTNELGDAHEDSRDWLEDRLFSVWPGGWPGRQLVDLDFLGDPGYWIQTCMSQSYFEYLFGYSRMDADEARQLASEYLSEISEQGYPMPWDFDDEPHNEEAVERDIDEIGLEFQGFLAQWRENVVKDFEDENASKAGSSG